MPKTLLLADDSVTIQKVVGITFANEDVDLVTVDNGDDALSRAREVMPDLVLADIGMPGLTGYELCAEIRRTPEISHVPVLLLTGTFETYDEARAREVGASDHISKPFEAQALVQMVHRLLDEADAGQGATVVADPLAPPAAPPVTAPPAAAPATEPPAFAAAAMPDPGDSGSNMLPEIPELPNTSFRDLGSPDDFATPGAAAPAATDDPFAPSSTPPEPAHDELPDMPEVPEAPFALPPLPAASAPEPDPPALPPAEPLDAPPAYGDPDGETAFLDPLADFSRDTLATPADEDLPEPAVDPQGDTSPTYADGRPIVVPAPSAEDSGSSDRAAAAEQSWSGRPQTEDGSAGLPAPELPDFSGDEPARAAEPEATPGLPRTGIPTWPAPPAAAPGPIPGPEEADEEPEEIALVETAPEPDDGWPAPAEVVEPEPLAATEPDLGEPHDDASEPEIVPEPVAPHEAEPAVAAEPEPPAAAPAAAPALDADAVHGAIEKIAWEAFGSLSQELVERFTARVEAIVWEIVPQVAERLVREEIERLKGDPGA